MKAWVLGVVISLIATAGAAAEPAAGQFGQVLKRAQQFKDVQMTDEEEEELGAAVSARIRERYGVVQDPAVHKYVTLVGTVLAQASERPNLSWQFIVLDTDGVNALAAPGGYVHITRGALSLMKSEAELAGVLAHELVHVTEKHTIREIQKGKLAKMGSDETLKGNKALFSQLVDKATEVVMAGFGRAEELESDEDGVVLASTVGYAPAGLPDFLRTIAERNKSSTEKQGLFASHPQMQERLDKLQKTIASKKLAGTAVVDARFKKHVTYTPVALAAVTTVEGGSAGLASASSSSTTTEEKPKEEKKSRFGLSKLVAPSGGEKKSAETTGSHASRGVDVERLAKGGPNAKPVEVKVTAAELAAFKKDGSLS